MLFIIILNAALCALVVFAVVGIQLRAIWTSNPPETLPSFRFSRKRRALGRRASSQRRRYSLNDARRESA